MVIQTGEVICREARNAEVTNWRMWQLQRGTWFPVQCQTTDHVQQTINNLMKRNAPATDRFPLIAHKKIATL